MKVPKVDHVLSQQGGDIIMNLKYFTTQLFVHFNVCEGDSREIQRYIHKGGSSQETGTPRLPNSFLEKEKCRGPMTDVRYN